MDPASSGHYIYIYAMAKKKLLLAYRLFSAMFSLLFHGRKPSSLSRPPPMAAAPPASPSPVVHHGAPPPSALAAAGQTLVLDVDAALLRSTSTSGAAAVDGLFPYFMLVALEAGGYLRGLALLLLYPLLRLLRRRRGAAVRAMAAVSFCGLRAARFRAGRAVLPKWLVDDVAAEAFDSAARHAAAGGRVVCVSAMPRVMVDAFLREYLQMEAVAAPEMEVVRGFYTGAMVAAGDEEQQQHLAAAVMATAPEKEEEENVVVGFAGSEEFLQHSLSRCCKEIFVVSSDEKDRWRPLPRDKYPQPIVFHDGRMAFRPTAAATLAMFLWLPLGAALGAARLAVALTVPYRYAAPILAATGMSWRLAGALPSSAGGHGGGRRRGQLFACNHRTLIDPVYVSVALDRPVRAVSYSLSRLSELISPIGRTVRLTRDRAGDGAAMARLLAAGDLVVVCPEGTTCREPYLLRFSPLFAELSDDVVPVGIAVDTAMFYATTAGGLKCFDPLYYMANPRMCYTVQFLEKVDTSAARSGAAPSTDVANLVQRKMGEALGYGCTMLTRKDKYLMLAGNDGVIGGRSAAAAAGKKRNNGDKMSAEKN